MVHNETYFVGSTYSPRMSATKTYTVEKIDNIRVLNIKHTVEINGLKLPDREQPNRTLYNLISIHKYR